MTIKSILAAGPVLFFFFCWQSVSGQRLDTIRIDNKQSILNGKAFFIFPTYASNIKRGVDIMSADPNANEETRIILDIGEMRLVFFAQELFVLGDKDLLTTVTNDNAAGKFKTKMITDRDSLQSFLSIPTIFDSTRDAILVNSLLVRTQDNTIFRISAYINPKAFRLRDEFQKLTENVFSTLSKGTRKNNLAARQEKLSIFGTSKSFNFRLPANYSITVDQQHDFQVFKLHRYQSLTDTSWIQLIIYTGHYPSPFYKDYNLAETDAQKVKGKFLNQNIDWLLFNIAKQGFFDKEQKIFADNIAKGLIVHIAMLSNQLKLIDVTTQIVENIQLSEK